MQIIYLLLAVKMFAKLESNQKSASHKLNMSSIKEGLALRKSWGSLVSIGTFILLVQILGVFLTSGAFRFLRPLTAGHTSGLEIEKWFVVSSGFATTLGVAVSSAFLSKYVKKERAFLAKSLPLARRIIIVGIICLSLLLKFGEHFNQWAFGSFYFALVVLCCTLSISCIGLLMWDFFTRTKVGLPATWLSLQSLLVSFGYFAFCQFGSLATDMNIYVAPLCAAGLLVVLIGFIPREQFGYESTANEKT